MEIISENSFRLVSVIRANGMTGREIEDAVKLFYKEKSGGFRCANCGEAFLLTKRARKYCSSRCQTAAAMRRFRASK